VAAQIAVRGAEPADYDRIAPLVDEWWGGRAMIDVLPRLFFVHFRDTAFVAEDDSGLAGFLAGFLSQSRPDEAYIHFVGVAPSQRGQGVGRMLYERFFAVARERSRTVVRCVTAPVNERSVAFHRAMGFEVERMAPNYDGRGGDRVLMVKRLERAPKGV
jgi:ribosomal protein S18 acetylase RimI-like enzyme